MGNKGKIEFVNWIDKKNQMIGGGKDTIRFYLAEEDYFDCHMEVEKKKLIVRFVGRRGVEGLIIVRPRASDEIEIEIEG